MKKDNFMYSCLSAGRGAKKAARGALPFAARAGQLFASHQLVGNFFHYRTAIRILGMDYSDVFDGGRLDLDPARWADFGPLNFHAGPPAGVLPVLKRAVTQRDLTYYPPNIVPELKAAAASVVFSRSCGKDFEIMATEGVQAALAYTVFTFVNPGDEVIITDPGYFFLEPPVIAAGGEGLAPGPGGPGAGHNEEDESRHRLRSCEPVRHRADQGRAGGDNRYRQPAQHHSHQQRHARVSPAEPGCPALSHGLPAA